MKKRICLLLLWVLLMQSLASCAQSLERDYFAYRSGDFVGEVRGSMNGVEFCAAIDLQKVGDEWRVSVSYLAPDVLEGCVISAVCDAKGMPIGKVEMHRSEESFVGDGVVFSGLLRPASLWLLQAEIASVQKNGGEYLLTFSTGEIMRLREDGFPILVSGDDFSMEMVWIERRR